MTDAIPDRSNTPERRIPYLQEQVSHTITLRKAVESTSEVNNNTCVCQNLSDSTDSDLPKGGDDLKHQLETIFKQLSRMFAIFERSINHIQERYIAEAACDADIESVAFILNCVVTKVGVELDNQRRTLSEIYRRLCRSERKNNTTDDTNDTTIIDRCDSTNKDATQIKVTQDISPRSARSESSPVEDIRPPASPDTDNERIVSSTPVPISDNLEDSDALDDLSPATCDSQASTVFLNRSQKCTRVALHNEDAATAETGRNVEEDVSALSDADIDVVNVSVTSPPTLRTVKTRVSLDSSLFHSSTQSLFSRSDEVGSESEERPLSEDGEKTPPTQSTDFASDVEQCSSESEDEYVPRHKSRIRANPSPAKTRNFTFRSLRNSVTEEPRHEGRRRTHSPSNEKLQMECRVLIKRTKS